MLFQGTLNKICSNLGYSSPRHPGPQTKKYIWLKDRDFSRHEVYVGSRMTCSWGSCSFANRLVKGLRDLENNVTTLKAFANGDTGVK